MFLFDVSTLAKLKEKCSTEHEHKDKRVRCINMSAATSIREERHEANFRLGFEHQNTSVMVNGSFESCAKRVYGRKGNGKKDANSLNITVYHSIALSFAEKNGFDLKSDSHLKQLHYYYDTYINASPIIMSMLALLPSIKQAVKFGRVLIILESRTSINCTVFSQHFQIK